MVSHVIEVSSTQPAHFGTLSHRTESTNRQTFVITVKKNQKQSVHQLQKKQKQNPE